MNHMYYDISNLNAQWDDVPLQGLGGGILSTGPIGSLGASSATYPWKEYSADTKALQQVTNEALKAHGYCPIGVDGKLGAATCGAVQKMLDLTGQSEQSPPSTCQSFTAPKKGPCGVSTPAPAAPAPPATTAMTMTPRGKSGGTMWIVLGGVVAVGAIGAAVYFSKKGR